jgi:hypothetical protein
VRTLAHEETELEMTIVENLLATYNLISAVQFATRIISRTNSVVDNNTLIDISHIRKYTACLFIKDLSDHDTQTIKLQNTLTQNKLSETKIIRKFTKYSINYCKIKPSHETWNNLSNENNDKMLKNSHETYLIFIYLTFTKRKYWLRKKERKHIDD